MTDHRSVDAVLHVLIRPDPDREPIAFAVLHLALLDADRVETARHGGTECLKRDLAVIACAHSFSDGGDPVGVKPREEYGCFHLRAGHRRRVVDRLQRRACDSERCVSLRQPNARAHGFERLTDAFVRRIEDPLKPRTDKGSIRTNTILLLLAALAVVAGSTFLFFSLAQL